MAAKHILPILGVGLVIIAPFLAANRSVGISKEMTGKTLVNKEFTVKVNDINKSNNGFVTCTYYISELQKELMGPCDTTGDMDLLVGRTYTVTSATIDDNFIIINNAKLIAGMIRVQVVRVGHIGHTRMAWLSNGQIIGGDNVAEGDWISIE